MSNPFTREVYNDIMRQQNYLGQHPPEDADCQLTPPMDEITDPGHIITKWDIQKLLDRMNLICPNNNFDEHETDRDPRLLQSTIDKINKAIDAGWCGCKTKGGGGGGGGEPPKPNPTPPPLPPPDPNDNCLEWYVHINYFVTDLWSGHVWPCGAQAGCSSTDDTREALAAWLADYIAQQTESWANWWPPVSLEWEDPEYTCCMFKQSG
jgi:hypothetical protein